MIYGPLLPRLLARYWLLLPFLLLLLLLMDWTGHSIPLQAGRS